MGNQIIKQPNGKYCIFSSVVDNVVYYDGTKEQITEYFVELEAGNIRRRLNQIFSDLENGEKPYYQFTKTFDQMIETIKEIHGKKESEEVLKLLKP